MKYYPHGKHKNLKRRDNSDINSVDIICPICSEALPYTFAQLICIESVDCPFCENPIPIDQNELLNTINNITKRNP